MLQKNCPGEHRQDGILIAEDAMASSLFRSNILGAEYTLTAELRRSDILVANDLLTEELRRRDILVANDLLTEELRRSDISIILCHETGIIMFGTIICRALVTNSHAESIYQNCYL
jgi:hypothetical protein